MNTYGKIKRPFYAWALILLILFQWVGGRIYINAGYAVEVETRMNNREKAIAAKMEAETGIKARVQIQDEEQLEALHRLGYGAPYIFTEEDNGQVSYFTINNQATERIQVRYQPVNQPDQDERSAKKAVLERLFSSFCLEDPESLPAVGPLLHRNVFAFVPPCGRLNISIPAPPPRLV
ncbi:MAG: hypothetical protein H6562_10315 [Lewinellaceae bacterium]|nr:hypothetical protein [Lewinella sp.]MCB9279299.1 hypothetical protein [Lewinellaceae bacterium]